ncbi:Rieske (2Fe-2S) protein [Salicibibacter cibi]|uniref:Rieske (2Fe-2S) protein n=1 Tax=Salicibibacter cibi TaxID=2743001 RepID=A0A7T6ZC99_9BACI|nr:Rieske (2Fe-2S) protein [Salicibibacter cibi]QQK80766.1 Rieske (2Fe-2S) protein [Salicibibacter cibi]
MKEVVCKKEDLSPGNIMSANVGPIPIVLCRTPDGEFYAYTNKCIHQGAPMSEGVLCGASAPTDTPGEYRYEKEGEILRCPWHGMEFDIKNEGRMLVDSNRKLGNFNVSFDGNDVVVSTKK